nr:unnamed protein product [Callosobruchus chinensis]
MPSNWTPPPTHRVEKRRWRKSCRIYH